MFRPMRTALLLSTLILLPVAALAQPAVPAAPAARNDAPAAMAPAPAARTAAPTATPAPVIRPAASADDPPTTDAVTVRPATPAPVASAAPTPRSSSAAVPAVGPAASTSAAPPSSAPTAVDTPPTTTAAASAPPTTDAPPTTTASVPDGPPSPESLLTVARNSPLTPEGNAAFLANYATMPGVVKLPSGTMYRVLVTGKGKASPLGRGDMVTVSYRGWLINGTSFDSSPVGSPRTFAITALIPGWREALLKMKEGDLYEIVIPADQAYGAEGRPGRIPPNQALVFVVSLAKVEFAG
jgi:hypothetical protein